MQGWWVFGDATVFFLPFPPATRILKTLCRKLRLPESFDFAHLAHMTPGYVGADLLALCREAAMCTVNSVLVKREEEKREALRGGEGTSGQGAKRNTGELLKKDHEVSELPTKVYKAVIIIVPRNFYYYSAQESFFYLDKSCR